MPWRENVDPYAIMVSEIMLQQTQVSRVLPKFDQFIQQFPDITSLATAPLSAVLSVWNGLGYNRRARFIHEAAKQVQVQGGTLPRTQETLAALPGIGVHTAGAIMNYAYEVPTVYIETNIRTVYLHHFFAGVVEPVRDTELLKVIGQTLDHEHPRQWHWALMDYGAYLKKTSSSVLMQSKHYKKQTVFKDSLRQMRGRIIKQLSFGPAAESILRPAVLADDRFEVALHALAREGLIECDKNIWCLTGHPKTS